MVRELAQAFRVRIATRLLGDATLTLYVRLAFVAVGGQLLWRFISTSFSAKQEFRKLAGFLTTVPVLMLNGRFDFVFPLETNQVPFFEMLATPAANKRHVVYEAGHFAFPLGDAIRENVAWLDRHLGPTGLDQASIPAAMRAAPPRDPSAP